MQRYIHGKKRKLKRTDFEQFGVALKLSERLILKAAGHLADAVSEVLTMAFQTSFLPQNMREKTAELIL